MRKNHNHRRISSLISQTIIFSSAQAYGRPVGHRSALLSGVRIQPDRHSIEEQPGTAYADTARAPRTASKPSISIARSRTLYCTSAVWHLAAPRLPTRTHVICCVLAGPTGPGVARPPAAAFSFLYWKGEAPPPPGICACCFARAAQACETNAIASR